MNKSSDDWNKLKHLVDLSAENARLKAEVERLTAEVSFDKRVQLHIDKLVAEFTQCQVERLQAEVERLRLQVGTDAIDREHGMCCDSSAENARLKAEVERLRKAGDAMAKVIPDIMDYRFDGNECDKELKAWNAAKDGKLP